MSMPKAPIIEKPQLDDYIEMKIENAVLKYKGALPIQIDEEPQDGLGEDEGDE